MKPGLFASHITILPTYQHGQSIDFTAITAQLPGDVDVFTSVSKFCKYANVRWGILKLSSFTATINLAPNEHSHDIIVIIGSQLWQKIRK